MKSREITVKANDLRVGDIVLPSPGGIALSVTAVEIVDDTVRARMFSMEHCIDTDAYHDISDSLRILRGVK